MNKANKILIGLMSLIFGFISLGCQSQNQSKNSLELPNIILIMADDMGYECVGFNGCIEYKTPNLNRLASAGIRFEHCYSQPLCTPSRVKIMTGKSNARNYVDFEYLSPKEKTFGNFLKEVGYATCIAGKWQLNGLHHQYPGNHDVSRPHHFGFDEYCLWHLNHTRVEGERYADPLLIQNGKDLPRNADAYGPDIISEFIINFIERKTKQPFFVYYPMVLPHSPFVPTPDSPQWSDPARRYEYDTTYFADMVSYIDKIIGRLEAKLKEKEIWENTVFIFTADNGTHPSVITETDDGSIKGAKGQSINTGNHVPMIISWPREIKKGRVFSGLVDFSDILPTLADIAGIDPSEYSTDGKSFKNVLKGDKRKLRKDEIFIHYSPRWGKFSHNRWVMNQNYKLYHDGEFYNTSNDPKEKNEITNLSKNEQKIRKRFEVTLQEKEKEVPYSWNNKEFKIR